MMTTKHAISFYASLIVQNVCGTLPIAACICQNSHDLNEQSPVNT